MVTRYNTGSHVGGAIRYNEEKVRNGEATLLAAVNFPSDKLAMNHVGYREDVLKVYADRNLQISKPAVHLVLAYSPTEVIDDAKMKLISEEFLQGIGFGNQPYLLYRHGDTNHPHSHIVTVRVDELGKAIPDTKIRYRCNDTRKALELKHNLIKAEDQKQTQGFMAKLPEQGLEYGKQETKKAIGQVVRTAMQEYTFSRLDEFTTFLSRYNVQMNLLSGKGEQTWQGITFQLSHGENPLSPAIKASSFSFLPTLKNLEVHFKKGAQKKNLQKHLAVQKIEQAIRPYQQLTEADFTHRVRQAGIEVVESGATYLYIDHANRTVYSEADLGEPFRRASLRATFAPQSLLKQERKYVPDTGKKPVQNRKDRDKKQPQTRKQPPSTTILTEAERIQLGKLVSKHYQQYKKEHAIFYESQLIHHFPFNTLVASVERDGHATDRALAAVTEFERYKRQQLPEIQAREAHYFSQTTQAYLTLAQRLPLSYENRLQVLTQLGLQVSRTPTGQTQLRSPQQPNYTYVVANAEQTRLLQPEAGQPGQPAQTLPMPLSTVRFNSAELSLLKALATQTSLQTLPETLTPARINTKLFSQLLPEPLFEVASRELNRRYLTEIQTLAHQRGNPGLRFYYQHGLCFQSEPGGFRAGFVGSPLASYQPIGEPLHSQLKALANPPQADEPLVQQLDTPLGRKLIRYCQLAYLPDSPDHQRIRHYIETQVAKDDPRLKGLTGPDLIERLTRKIEALAQPEGIRLTPGGLAPGSPEERAAVYTLLQRDLTAYRLEQGVRYESSLLLVGGNFPQTRLTNHLIDRRPGLMPLQANQYVEAFKQHRLGQLGAQRSQDQARFTRLSRGLLQLVSQAPVSVADRVKLLEAFSLEVVRQAGGYALVERQPRQTRIHPLSVALPSEQINTLKAQVKQPQAVRIPATRFLTEERHCYEQVALGKPLTLSAKAGKAVTTADLQLDRMRVLLPVGSFNTLTEQLNRSTVDALLDELNRRAPNLSLSARQTILSDQFYQRGFVLLGTPETGYVAGHYLSDTRTFAPVPTNLVQPGLGSVKDYQTRRAQLGSAAGQRMSRLAEALASGNTQRIGYAVQQAIRYNPALAREEQAPERLVGKLMLESRREADQPQLLSQQATAAVDSAAVDTAEDNLGKAIDAGMNTQYAIGKKKKIGTPTKRRGPRR